jgi:hypothetical protein
VSQKWVCVWGHMRHGQNYSIILTLQCLQPIDS